MAFVPEQKFRVTIDPRYSDEEREAIAQAIIDHVVERTKKGKGVNGEPLASYTGENKKDGAYSFGYTHSLDFKIAGKSKSKVNLTLSGDMLASIQKLKEGQDYIEIGIPRDDPNHDKAAGNQLGTYGQPMKVTKERHFLGISNSDLNKVLRDFPLEDKDALSEIVTVSKVSKSVGDILARNFILDIEDE